MKKRSGIIILLISFLFIAAEVLAFMIFIRPGMKMEEFYDEAVKGNFEGMNRIYSSLSRDDKEDALGLMNDIAVHFTNDYISGKINYDELSVVLQAILDMDEIVRKDDLSGGGKFSSNWIKCYTSANKMELDRRFKICANELCLNGREGSYDRYLVDFRNVYNLTYAAGGSVSNSQRNLSKDYVNEIDAFFEKRINSLYNSYLNGKIENDMIQAYIDTSKELFSGNAESAASAIEEEHSALGSFDENFDKFQSMIDNGQYVEAVDGLDKYVEEKRNDRLFKDYLTKFEELRKRAVEMAAGFYPSEILNLIKKNDINGAADLLDKVDKVFGNEVNLTEQKAFLSNYWKLAYYNYMVNMEDNLRMDLSRGVSVGEFSNSLDINQSTGKPDLMCFKDLDGGGIPELILYNSSTGFTYIFTCMEGRVDLAGCLKVLAYGKDPCDIIAEPYSGKAGNMEVKRVLCRYSQSNASFSVEKYCYRNRDYTYFNINGTEYQILPEDPSKPKEEKGEDFAVIVKRFDDAEKEIADYTEKWGCEPPESDSVTIIRYFDYIYSYK